MRHLRVVYIKCACWEWCGVDRQQRRATVWFMYEYTRVNDPTRAEVLLPPLTSLVLQVVLVENQLSHHLKQLNNRVLSFHNAIELFDFPSTMLLNILMNVRQQCYWTHYWMFDYNAIEHTIECSTTMILNILMNVRQQCFWTILLNVRQQCYRIIYKSAIEYLTLLGLYRVRVLKETPLEHINH